MFFLRAAVGYYADGLNHSGLLYQLSLNHTAGRYTTEELTVGRNLSSFDQEDITYEYYRLDQILGPTLSTTLFLTHASYQDLVNDGGSNFTDELGGLQVNWTVGPRTTLTLAGIYERQGEFGGIRRDTTTGRVTLDHVLTDTLTIQLLYEDNHVVSNVKRDSYDENIFYIRLIKLFD